MKNEEPKPAPKPKEVEPANLLTLSFPVQTWNTVFRHLMPKLEIFADHEARGDYKNRPDLLEQADDLRKVAIAIAQDQGRGNPDVAIDLGLPELISHPRDFEYFQELAMELKKKPFSSLDVAERKLVHFIEKEAKSRAEKNLQTGRNNF